MATDPWVGQVLGGRYKIEELLGQGGMSSVYKAFDPNLRRTVAVKLIHPHLSNNAEFVQRFESEATAIARLRHSNIVQVFDFNHEGDLYYMVLEYVAGETLQCRIKRLNETNRRLPVGDALRFTIDICQAADYAHQRGLIHRDIKPANVMLDVCGHAILMDFGIARILGGQQHTATGAVLGTAMYMSPEQIQGLHPDARSDIYSIGVTLFEALGGRPPFKADSMMTLMMMHLNDPVPDLSQLHPGIPAPVKALVNRALEKDRAHRFQSCPEMAAALQQALDNLGEPAVAAASAAGSTPIYTSPPPPFETVIEAPPPPGAAATVIEPAAFAAPPTVQVQPPVSRQGPAELGLAQPGPSAGPVPEWQPMEPVRAAPRKKTLLWGSLAVVLLVVLAGGGLFLLGAIRAMLPGKPARETSLPTLSLAAVVTDTPSLPLVSSTGTSASAAALPLPTSTATAEPTATSEPTLESTLAPTITPTNPPALPVIGGADKIAFSLNQDIWVANVDGSQTQQLTRDGTTKKDLRWLPGGQGLSYISGKCIQTVSLEGAVAPVTCFNNSDYLDAFEVSPDGQRVAISLDRLLYLLPFDLARLAEANTHAELAALAGCPELAPYQRNSAISARWSKDSQALAVVALGVLGDGRRGEIVQLVAVDRCIANPMVQVQFPQPHFTFSEYNHQPTLPGLAWDGGVLFALNGLTRNDGFGELHIFNRETYKALLSINPVNKHCCYSGPQFSPDGEYLLFAFQDISLGAHSVTQIYYIPYGTLGTGMAYEPLPLPEYTNPREQPQPVLRPALEPALGP
jgi:tRNA A-37 threonylcarbamoyl transferase component Bud32